MRDYRDAKAMAQALRDNLKSKNITLSVAESLELVAKQFGFDNWNILAAQVTNAGTRPKAGEGVEFSATIPVIRMFDVGKAKEFYVDFLGFTIDWEGHIREGAPLYMQLSRDGLTLHLSEHHGDAAPGGTTVVRTTGIEKFHAELLGKDYKYNRPRPRHRALWRKGDVHYRPLRQPPAFRTGDSQMSTKPSGTMRRR